MCHKKDDGGRKVVWCTGRDDGGIAYLGSKSVASSALALCSTSGWLILWRAALEELQKEIGAGGCQRLICFISKDFYAFIASALGVEDIEEWRALFSSSVEKPWVVNASSRSDGAKQTFSYLSRYTHSVAISEHRILELTSKSLSNIFYPAAFTRYAILGSGRRRIESGSWQNVKLCCSMFHCN